MPKDELETLINVKNSLYAVIADIDGRLQEITDNAPKPQPATDEPTLQDLKQAADLAMRATTVERVKQLFAGYGIGKVSDFKPEQYGNVIEALQELVENAKKHSMKGEDVDASED